MYDLLRKIADSSALAHKRTGKNDLAQKRQAIDIATSEVAVNGATVLCGVERFNGTVSLVIVKIELPEGSVRLGHACATLNCDYFYKTYIYSPIPPLPQDN